MTKQAILMTMLLAACSTTSRAPAPTPAVAEPAAATVAELAARRAQMIEWLHEYEQAGVFPTDAAGMPLSVFRDARGVRCPMAELIHRSGRDDLVDAVAREANALRLADVHDGPLYAWMMRSGLTQDEIAMVQGAMTIDEMRMMRELPVQDLRIASANGVVHGKLETAEIALRNATAHSVSVAAARLPAARAHAAGPVVPKAAVHDVAAARVRR